MDGETTVQQIEDFWKTQKPNASSTNMAEISTICEYDMGGEGDLFEAPKPVVEEPVPPMDLMTAAISMISSGEDVMSSQELKVADFEAHQNDPLLSDVFYACKKDLLEKVVMKTMPSETQTLAIKSCSDAPFQKSISSGSLTTMERMNRETYKPGLVDFHGMDVNGMRRAFSEGDIKGLCKDQIIPTHCFLNRPLIPTTEERKEKLSRYRNKRSKRNFGRKIKYACRKALADNQPRIRGRFARTEESLAKKGTNQASYNALNSKWRHAFVHKHIGF